MIKHFLPFLLIVWSLACNGQDSSSIKSLLLKNDFQEIVMNKPGQTAQEMIQYSYAALAQLKIKLSKETLDQVRVDDIKSDYFLLKNYYEILAMVHLYRSNQDSALINLIAARDQYKITQSSKPYLRDYYFTVNNIAGLLWLFGKKASFPERFEKLMYEVTQDLIASENIATTKNDTLLLAYSQLNRGSLLLFWGRDTDNAKSLIESSLVHAKNIHQKALLASAYLSVAIAEYEHGFITLSLEHADKAIENSQHPGYNYPYPVQLLTLSKAKLLKAKGLIHEGKYSVATSIMRKIISDSSLLPYSIVTEANFILTDGYLRARKYDSASFYFNKFNSPLKIKSLESSIWKSDKEEMEKVISDVTNYINESKQHEKQKQFYLLLTCIALLAVFIFLLFRYLHISKKYKKDKEELDTLNRLSE